jgi:DoxX-like protein/transposase IS481 family protein
MAAYGTDPQKYLPPHASQLGVIPREVVDERELRSMVWGVQHPDPEEALMAHRTARLNVFGRQLLVTRIEVEGWPVAKAAEAQGVSRTTAHKWIGRYRAEGWGGLEDRSIGALELLAAIGLIVPAATGILPWLTPVAASCLAILMALAAVFHLRRPGEGQNIVLNAILGAIALLVAYGRFVVEPL